MVIERRVYTRTSYEHQPIEGDRTASAEAIVPIVRMVSCTHVDLIVIQRSCSSLRVSVKRVSPALEEAMIPALHTKESVKVDLPWST